MQSKESPNFKPHPLLDHLREKYKLADDKQLSVKTGIHRSNLSRIRNGFMKVSNSNLVRINESTGISIKKLRELIAEVKP